MRHPSFSHHTASKGGSVKVLILERRAARVVGGRREPPEENGSDAQETTREFNPSVWARYRGWRLKIAERY